MIKTTITSGQIWWMKWTAFPTSSQKMSRVTNY
jgi:hypothetical protein